MADDQKSFLFDPSEVEEYRKLATAQPAAQANTEGAHPWLAAAIRGIGGLGSGILAMAPGLGTAGGALVGGGAEKLAEMVNQEPTNPTAIVTEAVLGAIPLSKVYKAIKAGSVGAQVAANALRGAALNEAAVTARRFAHGEDMTPQTGDIVGAALGAAPALLGFKGVMTKPTVEPNAKPPVGKPERYAPNVSGIEAAGPVAARDASSHRVPVMASEDTAKQRAVGDAFDQYKPNTSGVRSTPLFNTVEPGTNQAVPDAATAQPVFERYAPNVSGGVQAGDPNAPGVASPETYSAPKPAVNKKLLDPAYVAGQKYPTQKAALADLARTGKAGDAIPTAKKGQWRVVFDDALQPSEQKPDLSPTVAPSENKEQTLDEATDAAKTAVVRHGATDLNGTGDNAKTSTEAIRGWKNVPLNDKGRAEAAAAGEALKKVNDVYPFDAIHASDLDRAQETAQILQQKLGGDIPINIDPRLKPWNVGDMTGKPADQVIPLMHHLIDNPDVPAPNGESFNQFLGRILPALKEIHESDAHNILVGHTRTIAALEALAKNDGELAIPNDIFKIKHPLNPGGVMFVGNDWKTSFGKTPEESVAKTVGELPQQSLQEKIQESLAGVKPQNGAPQTPPTLTAGQEPTAQQLAAQAPKRFHDQLDIPQTATDAAEAATKAAAGNGDSLQAIKDAMAELQEALGGKAEPEVPPVSPQTPPEEPPPTAPVPKTPKGPKPKGGAPATIKAVGGVTGDPEMIKALREEMGEWSNKDLKSVVGSKRYDPTMQQLAQEEIDRRALAAGPAKPILAVDNTGKGPVAPIAPEAPTEAPNVPETPSTTPNISPLTPSTNAPIPNKAAVALQPLIDAFDAADSKYGAMKDAVRAGKATPDQLRQAGVEYGNAKAALAAARKQALENGQDIPPEALGLSNQGPKVQQGPARPVGRPKKVTSEAPTVTAAGIPAEPLTKGYKNTFEQMSARANRPLSANELDLSNATSGKDIQQAIVDKLQAYKEQVDAAKADTGINEKGAKIQYTPLPKPITIAVPGGPVYTIGPDQVDNALNIFNSKDAGSALRGIVDKSGNTLTKTPKETNWGSANKAVTVKEGESPNPALSDTLFKNLSDSVPEAKQPALRSYIDDKLAGNDPSSQYSFGYKKVKSLNKQIAQTVNDTPVITEHPNVVGPTAVGEPSKVPDLPPQQQQTTLSKTLKSGKSPFTGKQKGEIDPALLSLGLGVGGAVAGAALTPSHPLLGAVIGGLGGAAVGGAGLYMPSAIRAIEPEIGANTLPGAEQRAASQELAKKVVDSVTNFMRLLPDVFRGNLLASSNLPINIMAGHYGSAIMGSLEAFLSGDPRGFQALKMLLNTKEILRRIPLAYEESMKTIQGSGPMEDYVRGVRMPEGSALQKIQDIWSMPGVALNTGTLTAHGMVMDAGFTRAEADQMLLRSEPSSTIGKAGANFRRTQNDETGRASWLAQFLLPFYRTHVNQMEQSIVRMPILGPIMRRAWQMDPITMRQMLVQNAMTVGIGGLAYSAGAAIPEAERKPVEKAIIDFGGVYGGTAMLGFLAGMASKKTDSVSKQAVESVKGFINNDMPLPSTKPVIEAISTLQSIVDGKPLGKAAEQMPQGAIPMILSSRDRYTIPTAMRYAEGNKPWSEVEPTKSEYSLAAPFMSNPKLQKAPPTDAQLRVLRLKDKLKQIQERERAEREYQQ